MAELIPVPQHDALGSEFRHPIVHNLRKTFGLLGGAVFERGNLAFPLNLRAHAIHAAHFPSVEPTQFLNRVHHCPAIVLNCTWDVRCRDRSQPTERRFLDDL
ncbi:hypothetical protein NKH75_22935 [Mesorhizobium sp. M0984]|uniref:hypothetical protein n=1 Tax=Mesorhizobium sp. M0984 TaxID=2957041 RepID=UPI00333878DE